ncbi:hypothetical protein GQR58_013179 [Nymphon striatum]|nr:hypothetical protein GQR58_013179 [Nymphon striatum]
MKILIRFLFNFKFPVPATKTKLHSVQKKNSNNSIDFSTYHVHDVRSALCNDEISSKLCDKGNDDQYNHADKASSYSSNVFPEPDQIKSLTHNETIKNIESDSVRKEFSGKDLEVFLKLCDDTIGKNTPASIDNKYEEEKSISDVEKSQAKFSDLRQFLDYKRTDGQEIDNEYEENVEEEKSISGVEKSQVEFSDLRQFLDYKRNDGQEIDNEYEENVEEEKSISDVEKSQVEFSDLRQFLDYKRTDGQEIDNEYEENVEEEKSISDVEKSQVEFSDLRQFLDYKRNDGQEIDNKYEEEKSISDVEKSQVEFSDLRQFLDYKLSDGQGHGPMQDNEDTNNRSNNYDTVPIERNETGKGNDIQNENIELDSVRKEFCEKDQEVSLKLCDADIGKFTEASIEKKYEEKSVSNVDKSQAEFSDLRQFLNYKHNDDPRKPMRRPMEENEDTNNLSNNYDTEKVPFERHETDRGNDIQNEEGDDDWTDIETDSDHDVDIPKSKKNLFDKRSKQYTTLCFP